MRANWIEISKIMKHEKFDLLVNDVRFKFLFFSVTTSGRVLLALKPTDLHQLNVYEKIEDLF